MEDLFATLLEALVPVVATIVSAAVVYTLRRGLEFLKLKLSAEQYSFLQSATKTVVRFLEQAGLIDELLKEGAAKKEAALNLLANFAKEHGIPVSYELLDTLIEEAVQIMNEAIKQEFEDEFPAEDAS